MMSDVEELNRIELQREIMGRVAVVEHELGLIAGNLDDLAVYVPRDTAIDQTLSEAIVKVSFFRSGLVLRGFR